MMQREPGPARRPLLRTWTAPSGAAPLLAVEGLVAGYAAPVVGPLSFTVGRGEVVGLAGPNGAGKSTLLAALRGDARRFGGSVARAPGLRIAHHDQSGGGFAGLPVSARDLFALTGASPHGLPDWLAPLQDRRLDRLSGGQRQFLRLWAVIAAPADLVLLDEPANHLDAAGQAFLARWLGAPHADRGIVIVAHDAALLDAVCHRIVEVDR